MSAEDKLRYWIERCADCDCCRTVFEEGCQMFPELYKIWDERQESGEKITTNDMRRLIDLCNLCGTCPCPEVPTSLMEAKTEFVARNGLPLKIKAIERVELVGRVAGAVPGISNFFLRNPVTKGLLQSALGIHKDRSFPPFPKESFSDRMKDGTKPVRRPANAVRKVAYFAGCSARYYVPDVGTAAVEILQRNGVEVHIPEQKCCGMPPLLEGDKELALELAGFNLDQLAEAVEEGYDIVCSCPTCGFALKILLKQGAHYSDEYRAAHGLGEADWNNLLSVPIERRTGRWISEYGRLHGLRHMKDEGYFARLNGLKRVLVAENTYDLGEYLRNLHRLGELDATFGEVTARCAYYPPCHLREQGIGNPYADLLSLVPGLKIDSIEGYSYCCGAAGIMGFKRDFHDSSIKMANTLIDRIKALDPDKLLTDCLGCRYQFNHLTRYQVSHPIEIMKHAYDTYRSSAS
ncbi:MAG: heterodisulfide reductase-related iron-sulfur binding cluster [Desulfomonilaceae bacterium]|nr:heterodisulfide reductase-related iron-sulfur binding cluster [Desulfomonilaceae bacterium]